MVVLIPSWAQWDKERSCTSVRCRNWHLSTIFFYIYVNKICIVHLSWYFQLHNCAIFSLSEYPVSQTRLGWAANQTAWKMVENSAKKKLWESRLYVWTQWSRGRDFQVHNRWELARRVAMSLQFTSHTNKTTNPHTKRRWLRCAFTLDWNDLHPDEPFSTVQTRRNTAKPRRTFMVSFITHQLFRNTCDT